MESIASSPGKIILAGEHFVIYGGSAILCAINKRVVVTSTFVNKKTITINSDIKIECHNVSTSIQKINYKLRPFFHMAKNVLNEFKCKKGININIDSNIPIGVGLGSSSASCVATAASLLGLFKKYTKEEVIKLAIDGEKTIFKNTSGADCTICCYGGIIEYNKKKKTEKIKTDLNMHILIVNSLIKHSTLISVTKVNKFIKENKEKFYYLYMRESKLIKKMKKNLIINNIKKIGRCMSENQSYLEEIGVSNKKIDDIINKIKEFSYGAKITGAGDGGCIIILPIKEHINNINEFNQKHTTFFTRIEYEGVKTLSTNRS